MYHFSVQMMRCRISMKASFLCMSTGRESISIPQKIHRSKTDIVAALSKVGRDSTASHFKYHDDSYLIPQSNLQKRMFAMAQESGRNAARWIRQEQYEMFQHTIADPQIKCLLPKKVFTEDAEADETYFKQLIHNSELSDAVFIYNQMQTRGIELSNIIKQPFLELLCFYNHTEPPSEELTEERWFQQSAQGKERQRKTWKDGELAELVFSEIKPKTKSSYSAIIQGMCKYFQVERAYALFQEALEQNLQLDIDTFNSVISITSFLKESAEARWDLCQNILNQMNNLAVHPNLGTLNATLNSVSSLGNFRMARTISLKVLTEFKSLGIEPSLATWYYVLTTFCREKGPVSHILVDILNEIDGKEFEVCDNKDTYFFVTAMDVSRNHIHDTNVAKRVEKLLHSGKNYDLIGDSYKESIYYRHYLALLCQTEPFEEFMKVYDLLVPNVYTPEPGIMEEIIRVLGLSGALEYIPRIWSDMIIFDHTNRESLVNSIIKTIADSSRLDVAQTSLQEQLTFVAWDVYSRIDEQPEERAQKTNFSGQLLGNVLAILSRGNAFEKAKIVFRKLDKNYRIFGTPSISSLEQYIDLCIREKSPCDAIHCLEYCAEIGLDSSRLKQKVKQELPLNQIQEAKFMTLGTGK